MLYSLVSKSSLVVVVLGLLHLEMDTVFDMNAILVCLVLCV